MSDITMTIKFRDRHTGLYLLVLLALFHDCGDVITKLQVPCPLNMSDMISKFRIVAMFVTADLQRFT